MISTNGNRPVRVAFDSSALKPRYRNHGIQVYARNLLGSLRDAAPRHGMEIRPFVSAREEPAAATLQAGPNFHPRKTSLLQFDRLWRYGGATLAAFLDGADVMLNPNGASLPISTLMPIVTTIHDLTPMVMPHCFPARYISAQVSVIALGKSICQDHHRLRALQAGHRTHLRRSAIQGACCL